MLQEQIQEAEASMSREIGVPVGVRVGEQTDPSQLHFKPTQSFLERARDFFDPLRLCTIAEAGDTNSIESVAAVSNLVVDILAMRLETHIRTKVPEAKQRHYVWEFARSNLGRLAAVMVYFGHTRKDVLSAKRDKDVSLLANTNKGTFLSLDVVVLVHWRVPTFTMTMNVAALFVQEK